MLMGGEGDDRFAVSLGPGEITLSITEVPGAFLIRKRNRIMDLRLNLPLDTMLKQAISLFHPNHVEMIDMPDRLVPFRNLDEIGQFGERTVESAGIGNP